MRVLITFSVSKALVFISARFYNLFNVVKSMHSYKVETSNLDMMTTWVHVPINVTACGVDVCHSRSKKSWQIY